MELKYDVRIAHEHDQVHAKIIAAQIAIAANDPMNGICRRSEELIKQKILDGDAIIAITDSGKWIGFCYLQPWDDSFVSSCGLIVHSNYRQENFARQIKEAILQLAKQKYPMFTPFGLTTSLAVMKINSDLGYRPVTYSQITGDEHFWNSCKGCSNYPTLIARQKKNCFCTAMVYI